MQEPTENKELSQDEANTIRQEAKRLYETAQSAYFDLGKQLYDIAANELHIRWGYKTFEDYAHEELGCKQRKAFYLMKIYRRAIELGLPREELEAMGWTKAKEIVDFVETREDFEEWSERAKTLSTGRLIEAISIAKGKTVPKKGKDEEGNKTLENEDGEVFHIVEIPLSDAQYDNVKLALQVAGNIAGSEKRGHLIDLIALEFLAGHSDISDLGQKIADWAQKSLIEIEEEDEPTE
jgi:hypothetical protein